MGAQPHPQVVTDVDNSDQFMQLLIDEFATNIDESLVRAIASDFKFPEQYEQAKATLAPLAEAAAFEEATGFDPSGLGHQSGSDANADDNATPESRFTPSAATDFTSVSESSEPVCFTSQTDLSEEEKIDSLRVIFSTFKDHTLKFELKNAGGDVEKAFDSLLSRQFLDEAGELVKGIEGFYIDDDNYKPGKARREKENQGKTQLPVNYNLTPVVIETDDLTTSKPTKAWKPPSPSYHNPVALTQQTLPSSSSQPSYPPPKPSPSAWSLVAPRKKTSLPPKSPNLPTPFPTPTPTSTHRALTPSALQSASLRRKGPLYAQASAVYTTRSQAHASSFRLSVSHVASQSSARSIDLHGVPVLDGVKIARDRVNAWWDSLDEYERERRRATPGRELQVITGLGNHSVSGVSRLRQAVASMLTHAGWRFDTGTGEFFVNGRGAVVRR